MQKVVRGFTLIELMIAVAIIGVLAGIAYPSYLKQVQKSNRSDAKVVLNEVAQRLQRCFTANGRYNPADGVCGVVDAVKSTGGVVSTEGFYTVKIAAATDLTATAYLITATPISGTTQARDSDCARFTLNQLGVRAAYSSTNAINTDKCW